MSPTPNDYLERIKAEIRAEADAARIRDPLPRIDPAPRATVTCDDGIDRKRLDYAIGELTGADYRAFIDQAFRALLKRAPDDAGSEAQARLLAAGAPKAEILGNLRWSREGRHVGARVRGLLPRYVLAKLVRVPVLGYFAEWGLALAGLPMLLRHQRAADTANAARFNAATDAQREHGRRIDELHDALSGLRDDFSALRDELRDQLHRALLRLDALETRAARIEQRCDASANGQIELRHHVHAINHWVVSLQDSLAGLEDAAAADRAGADAFAAAMTDDATEARARAARHAEWSAALVARLAAPRVVLDLGSGDGIWLSALIARNAAASGIEANPVLAESARQRGLPVVVDDPQAALARCADASLDGLTLGVDVLDAKACVAMLHEARRALQPGGCLLLRVEAVPYRLDDGAALDAARWSARLAAAGLAVSGVLDAGSACAVLARRAAP